MIQGDERTLAGNAVAKSGSVGVPTELCPITVDDKGPSPHERILDFILESRVRVETRKSHSFQFKTLAGKVRINKLFDLTIGRIGAVDGGEV